ncbi:MAG: DNA polymerase III subunit gamma/tau [Cyanobacteriota bacterium]|nr:DNA polymerase III subunit gamma/tau [Cyanobacteriota bacterium]MDY6383334.1 DNA polymerase III subunit gamma/tau [Cyanobacteriota bacterium]
MDKSYIPLYRKYRPQKLDEIVGQEHIKKALTNAIETGRISHAYLFTGPRGTGKTSTARIFAKSLNCEKGPTINPCGKCENCVNITRAIPIDVIEIDAASNRSVNDAEEIIQNVAMAPINSRYKIYIIDEVHMLTPTAFNALLKTLEEPPENVIFILATTEVHKVLDTIKSRCQRFDFKRITTSDIAHHLRYISDKEEINITDDALNYIASNSAGGMRDSIALLDQLSVLNDSEKPIGADDINKLLGRLSFHSLTILFQSVIKSNADSASEILNDIYNQGNEPSQILSNFLEYLRNALIVKSVGENSENVVQLNKEQIKTLAGILKDVETHQIVSLIDKCANYIKELKLSTNPKLWLDVAVLDMANMMENTKLEQLQQRLQTLESGAPQRLSSPYNTPPKPVNKMEGVKHTFTKPEPQIQKVAPVHNEVKAQASVQNSDPPKNEPQATSSAGGDLWAKFLQSVSSFPSRTILKQQAIPVKLTPEEVIIAIKHSTWLKSFSPDGERFPFLQEASKAVFGTEPHIIVREPKQDDMKIQAAPDLTSPKADSTKKKLIINPPQESSEDVDDAIEQFEENEQSKQSVSAETPAKIPLKGSKNPDAAFHSDNVNMVMDLFDGKLIE